MPGLSCSQYRTDPSKSHKPLMAVLQIIFYGAANHALQTPGNRRRHRLHANKRKTFHMRVGRTKAVGSRKKGGHVKSWPGKNQTGRAPLFRKLAVWRWIVRADHEQPDISRKLLPSAPIACASPLRLNSFTHEEQELCVGGEFQFFA